MVRMSGDDERMAGSIPVWEKQSESSVSSVEPASGGNFPDTLSYAAAPAQQDPVQATQGFGFGDLVDMINPLQHIPIISHLYRNLTGDTINPASRVIGDTLFGGPMGGAASLANVIVEDQSGHDIADNIMMAMRGEKESSPAAPGNDPEKRLTQAVESAMGDSAKTEQSLPGTVLSLADLGTGRAAIPDAAPMPAAYGAAYWHLNE
jgi:hypothetical protein